MWKWLKSGGIWGFTVVLYSKNSQGSDFLLFWENAPKAAELEKTLNT